MPPYTRHVEQGLLRDDVPTETVAPSPAANSEIIDEDEADRQRDAEPGHDRRERGGKWTW